MKLAVALLLNTGLLLALAGALRHLYRQAGPRLQPWLWGTLAGRLLFSAAAYLKPSIDERYAIYWGRGITASLWQRSPGAAWQLLQTPGYVDVAGRWHPMYRWSQGLFYWKLHGVLGLATGGLRLPATLYLSLACFVGCWALVVAVRHAFARPRVTAAAGVAFLLWPTLLWWTGGLNKETVLVGAGAGLVALALPLLYGPAGQLRPGWRLAGRLLGWLLLAWLMTRVRYFFALPLLGGLLALAGVQLATRHGCLSARWPAQVGALLGLLLAQLAVANALGGRLLEVAYFVQEVNLNYLHGLATSAGRPHLEYAHWQASAGRLLAYVPLAALHTLTRPWLGEAAGWQYTGAALENLLLLGLLGRAGWAMLRGRPGALPVALAAMLLLYCLLLAAFIGLSTPNLGTLSRYRSVLLPWLLWLCLVNWQDGEAVSKPLAE